MAKDRARRRAEREAAAAEERRRREAQRRRSDQRAAVVGAVTAPASQAQSRLSRWWRRTYPKGDPFARGRRRRTYVVVAIIYILINLRALQRIRQRKANGGGTSPKNA